MPCFSPWAYDREGGYSPPVRPCKVPFKDRSKTLQSSVQKTGLVIEAPRLFLLYGTGGRIRGGLNMQLTEYRKTTPKKPLPYHPLLNLYRRNWTAQLTAFFPSSFSSIRFYLARPPTPQSLKVKPYKKKSQNGQQKKPFPFKQAPHQQTTQPYNRSLHGQTLPFSSGLRH